MVARFRRASAVEKGRDALTVVPSPRRCSDFLIPRCAFAVGAIFGATVVFYLLLQSVE